MAGASSAEQPDAEPRGAARLLVELAGVGAGILLFVYMVGGLVLAARMGALELPRVSTVALMSRETVLIAGVQLILPALLFGLGAVGVTWIVRPVSGPSDMTQKRVRRLDTLVVALVVCVVGYYFVLEPLSWWDRAVLAVIAAAGGITAHRIVRRAQGFWGLTAGLFALIAVISALCGFIRAAGPPVRLDFAVLHLEDGARTSGFLVARSSEATILVPDVEGRTVRRAVAIPTTNVVALRLYPGPPGGVTPLGSSAAVALIGEEQPRQRSAGPELSATRRFVASIRDSALWKFPPLLYPRSIRAWRRDYETFAGDLPQEWSNMGVRASLSDLIQEPTQFEGSVVIATARLAAAAIRPSDDPTVVRQWLVLDSGKGGRLRAVCPVASRPHQKPTIGRRVLIRGLVVASGVFVDGSGVERPRVAMVCAAVHEAP